MSDVQARISERNERDKATEAPRKEDVKKGQRREGRAHQGPYYIKVRTKEKPQRAKVQQYLK